MRYLITGLHGMVGSHLAEYLVRQNLGVVGGIRRTDDGDSVDSSVTEYTLDLRNYDDVLKCVDDFRPDAIFHLSAQTFVPDSWEKPQETFVNNTISEMNLFEAILELGISPVVHVASSGAVYGRVSEADAPLLEHHAMNPASPYAVSKVAQEYIARQYEQSHGMKMFITRTYNHTGPRRGEQYVESSFAKQLVEIELGMREPVIQVGNLASKRDFTDVRDVVRAYSDLVLSGVTGGVYHICSGQVISIEDLLDRFISLTRLSVRVVQDASRLRPADAPTIFGNNQKLRETISWKPEFTLDDTLRDLLDYWRLRLRKEVCCHVR